MSDLNKTSEDVSAEDMPAKRRGRPRKRVQETAAAEVSAKKRGRPKKNASAQTQKAERHDRPSELVFALDIGTRSVIGIVAEQRDGMLHILATERMEHKTRAMLDGQIHDVPQVAAVIREVKRRLTERTGTLHSVAVAAAGRALYTMTAEAEQDVTGIITPAQQRDLDFAGVQEAQRRLAHSHTVDDPTRYYCVGYSTIRYTLDGNDLKTLVGQRGRKAQATVIATFLPRQVVDSMQSALREAHLEMQALTLEPIAGINVLIPPTMRHLNLVLVDIGAGTSDVAITRGGSVIAYGMVPMAGDEVTEAISREYLLDFNIAEDIKRKTADGQDVSFTDILGMKLSLTAEQVVAAIKPGVENLADAIAKQVLELNGEPPQAVMLVGGGALTPMIPELVAEALDIPAGRVAVRQPEEVDGIADLPPELHAPDAVTPLGILKIASINTLHFLAVWINDIEYSLFNFRALNVSDALLAAGINLRKYNGRPGMGLVITVNGERRSFPGTMGTLAQITVDGKSATLDTPIHDDCRIKLVAGEDGRQPEIHLSEVIGEEEALFGFGDTRFVAGFGGFFAYHAVDEGGFADVGDAADKDAQGFVYALAVGNHGAAGLGDFAVCAGFGGIKGDGTGVGTAVVVFEPDFGALGVGKVLFVEDFEFGFAFGKLGKQGIFTGGGHTRIQHFNHHIDAFGAFGDGFFCFVHDEVV